MSASRLHSSMNAGNEHKSLFGMAIKAQVRYLLCVKGSSSAILYPASTSYAQAAACL
jgi:hypothetical protein